MVLPLYTNAAGYSDGEYLHEAQLPIMVVFHIIQFDHLYTQFHDFYAFALYNAIY